MITKLKPFIAHLRRIHAREPLILMALALCMGALYTFNEVAEEVVEGDTHSIDTSLLLLLRDPADHNNPIGPRWLEEMMRDFTGLGGIGILTIVTVCSALYLTVIRKAGQAFYLLMAVSTGILVSNLLKHSFDRPRPDLVPHGSIVYTASFPSGHAMMSAIVYLTLGALLADAQPDRRLKIFIMFMSVSLTLLIGISRVYLGVHWPSDVLAGWTGGAAWALLFWIGARYLKARQWTAHPEGGSS